MRTIIISSLILFALQACTSKASDNKIKDHDEIAVTVLPITENSSSTQITATGLLTTENEAKLSFKVSGIIEKIFVSEGQAVRKGQLLASLKANEIWAQVQQVRIGLEKAERDYQRAQNLYRDSVATLEQLQNARSALDMARQNYNQVTFNESYSKIYAPADGFIAKKLANEGELANGGNGVIVVNALSENSRWVLKAGVSDKDWSLIATGNKASVTFDAFPGRSFDAEVSRKTMSADQATGSFEIELRVNAGAAKPAAGMFGRAIIYPSSLSKGFTIPYESLVEANGKTGVVFVTNDRKSVKKVTVTITNITQDNMLITEGLQGYQYLVTSGSPFLNDRSVITVKN